MNRKFSQIDYFIKDIDWRNDVQEIIITSLLNLKLKSQSFTSKLGSKKYCNPHKFIKYIVKDLKALVLVADKEKTFELIGVEGFDLEKLKSSD